MPVDEKPVIYFAHPEDLSAEVIKRIQRAALEKFPASESAVSRVVAFKQHSAATTNSEDVLQYHKNLSAAAAEGIPGAAEQAVLKKTAAQMKIGQGTAIGDMLSFFGGADTSLVQDLQNRCKSMDKRRAENVIANHLMDQGRAAQWYEGTPELKEVSLRHHANGTVGSAEYHEEMTALELQAVRKASIFIAYGNGHFMDPVVALKAGVALAAGAHVFVYRDQPGMLPISPMFGSGLSQSDGGDDPFAQLVLEGCEAFSDKTHKWADIVDQIGRGALVLRKPFQHMSPQSPRTYLVHEFGDATHLQPHNDALRTNQCTLSQQSAMDGTVMADPTRWVQGEIRKIESCTDVVLITNGAQPSSHIMVMLGFAAQAGLNVHVYSPTTPYAPGLEGTIFDHPWVKAVAPSCVVYPSIKDYVSVLAEGQSEEVTNTRGDSTTPVFDASGARVPEGFDGAPALQQ